MRTHSRGVILAATWILQTLLAPAPSSAAMAPADAAPNQMVLSNETCRGLFFVPVTVGPGAGTTLDLLLDTGSSRTFIDPGALRRVLGRETRAGKVLFASARARGLELGPLKALVHPMEAIGLALGREFDGILGFPAFRDVLLTLDYVAGEVRVSRGSLPKVDGRRVFRYNGSKRPHLDVAVGGRHLEILIDSGATSEFLLKPGDQQAWSVEPKEAKAAVGFASVRVHKVGRLAGTLQFGPLTFQDPIVTVAGGERYAGWGVLRHFVLTFDQRHRRLRMEPADPAPVRMPSLVSSGMAFHPRPEGLEILRVFPGTSAASAGLREGDLVLAIDGTPVYQRGCGDPSGEAAGERQVVSYLSTGTETETAITFETLIP